MIKSLNEATALKFQNLNAEEKAKRGILGRLYGPVASFAAPTRNGRLYSQELWEKLFKSDLIKERFKNGGIFGQLCHPDYTEVDMEKIAVVMPEPPVKNDKGQLIAYLDIIDTPCGKIAYQLAKYGYKFGISSRGEGDLVTDYIGNESVDPETYSLTAFDLVEIPAVESARLSFVESLDRKKYNKTLRQALQESLDNASEDEKEIMQETLKDLDINLEEQTNNQNNNDEEVLFESESLDEGVLNAQLVIKDKLDNNRVLTRVRNLAAGAKYIQEHPEKDCQLWYRRVVDDVVDEKTELCLLTRIWDINDLKSRKFPVYIDLVYDKEYHDTGDTTHIQEALDNDKIVLQFLNYSKNPNYRIPVFKRADESLELNNDIKDEVLDNKSEVEGAVDTNEAFVEQLQTLIKANTNLEAQVVSLQERLSVCYAKEVTLTEENNKCKEAIQKLAEDSKAANAFQVKATKLEEKLEVANKNEKVLRAKILELHEQLEKVSNKSVSLTESLSSQEQTTDALKLRNKELVEKYNTLVEKSNKSQVSLKESAQTIKKLEHEKNLLASKHEAEKSKLIESLAQKEKDLKLSKDECEQKLQKSAALTEKYKKVATKAIDKYIESQAVRIGTSLNEVKSRLPKSYTFDDIDRICEELQDVNLTRSKLPFNAMSTTSLKENMKIQTKASPNESILPKSNVDDDIDADLISLANF